MAANSLLEIHGVRQTFPKAGGGDLVVLDGVEMTLAEGEIVGLLGRSGSGKSTLLRLIAGLARPVAGKVDYKGHEVIGPPEGITMVFQGFALFPWLNVLQNVQIGLEALKLDKAEIQKRSLEAIDLIGLDGYEHAYPRELSGGMRQRVGFARALVVHPDILLMDEPFSALDVLTAETLRTDLIELWAAKKLPIKGIILVTHNIEEAVLMCDRILVFSTNPGRVASEIKVTLPQPRNRLDPRFTQIVERIYVEMTTRLGDKNTGGYSAKACTLGTVLPRVSTNLLSGFIEAVAGEPYKGKADLPAIASGLHMEIDDLFPVAEILQTLRLAEVEGGDIRLTPAGMAFAGADLNERKKLFAKNLMSYVPLASHIRNVLDERENHRAPRRRFEDELEDHMSEQSAEQTLAAVVSWGRYAELFSYDDNAAVFSLENPT